MKYLLTGLLLATIAGVEFYHALHGEHASTDAVCVAPEVRSAAIRDVVLDHLRSH